MQRAFLVEAFQGDEELRILWQLISLPILTDNALPDAHRPIRQRIPVPATRTLKPRNQRPKDQLRTNAKEKPLEEPDEADIMPG